MSASFFLLHPCWLAHPARLPLSEGRTGTRLRLPSICLKKRDLIQRVVCATGGPLLALFTKGPPTNALRIGSQTGSSRFCCVTLHGMALS